MIPKAFKLVSRGKQKLYWVHENCAAYSPEVFQDEEGRWCNVLEAIKRSRSTRCAACKKKVKVNMNVHPEWCYHLAAGLPHGEACVGAVRAGQRFRQAGARLLAGGAQRVRLFN